MIFAIERPAQSSAASPNVQKELVRAGERAHQYMQRLHEQQARTNFEFTAYITEYMYNLRSKCVNGPFCALNAAADGIEAAALSRA